MRWPAISAACVGRDEEARPWPARSCEGVRVFELDQVTPQSLGAFLLRWYGPPDRPPGEGGALPSGLPEPLAEWYRLARRWSVPLSRDHVFVAADALDLHAEPVEFWRGVSDAYAFDRDGMVAERSAAGWLPTGLPLDRFLVYIGVYEAVYAPIHGLVHLDVPPDLLDRVLARLWPLTDPLWRWPDPAVRYYADDDLLVHAGAGRLVVSARHRDALGRFDGYALDWAWDSRAEPGP
jgi:hypothetical protein